jgi:limonene 1,2-monooxygenase
MLQLRPYQQPSIPVAVASVQSPAGVIVAGKHGAGVLSLSIPRDTVRKTTLKELWDIGEETAEKHGKTLRREEWSLVVSVHLAESRKEAIEAVRLGSGRELTEYFGATLGHPVPNVPADQVVDFMVQHKQWLIGTPDDCIAGIEELQEMSGGFGGFLVRVVDWATREQTLHSYELLARYVMPRFQGSLTGIHLSNQWASERKEALQVNRLAGLKRADEAYYGQKRT